MTKNRRNSKIAPKNENGITLIKIKIRFDTIKFIITKINVTPSLVFKKSPNQVPSQKRSPKIELANKKSEKSAFSILIVLMKYNC